MADFDEVNAALQAAGSDTDAAEAHGMLCGLICTHASNTESRWLAEVLGVDGGGDVLAREAATLLRGLYAETLEQLSSDGVVVELFLPSDVTPIIERTAGLSAWSRGLLLGLSIGGIDNRTKLSSQCREILHDVGEISCADVYRVTGTEEDEKALSELVEFLRVGVMLLGDELDTTPQRREGGANQHGSPR